MNGGEQAFINSKFIVEDFCDGRESVGGARRVGNNVMFLRVVLIVVHTQDNGDVFILRGRRDDDLLRAARFDVRFGFGRVGEKAGGFDDEFHAHVFPLDGARVFLG